MDAGYARQHCENLPTLKLTFAAAQNIMSQQRKLTNFSSSNIVETMQPSLTFCYSIKDKKKPPTSFLDIVIWCSQQFDLWPKYIQRRDSHCFCFSRFSRWMAAVFASTLWYQFSRQCRVLSTICEVLALDILSHSFI